MKQEFTKDLKLFRALYLPLGLCLFSLPLFSFMPVKFCLITNEYFQVPTFTYNIHKITFVYCKKGRMIIFIINKTFIYSFILSTNIGQAPSISRTYVMTRKKSLFFPSRCTQPDWYSRMCFLLSLCSKTQDFGSLPCSISLAHHFPASEITFSSMLPSQILIVPCYSSVP